ncbi:MAG: hypothetical protein K0R63_1058 [Rickettsiales bacterium]|nr:hypothetical protein [Rickettsiales bacterium]
MYRSLRIFSLVSLTFLVSACAGTIEKLRNTEPVSSPYHQALAREYLRLAESEAKQYDWVDSEHYAKKGLKAAQGGVIEPERIEEWNIPDAVQPEMMQARSYLMSTIDEQTIRQYPEHAAQAVTLFDCWVEEQEENWQLDSIDSCREEFYSVLDQLLGKLTTGAASRDEPVSLTYVLFFDFDSSKLDKSASGILQAIIADINSLKGKYEVTANGHADRAGTEEYNMKLSAKRADVVKKRLLKAGILAGSMQSFAFGESDPKEPTPDGVRNRANRRVEIIVTEQNGPSG